MDSLSLAILTARRKSTKILEFRLNPSHTRLRVGLSDKKGSTSSGQMGPSGGSKPSLSERLVQWYIDARIWLGLRFCSQPAPRIGRRVVNIGFGQYFKDRMSLNEVEALQYVSKWTAVPTSNIIGVWRSQEYLGAYRAIVKRVPGILLKNMWPRLKATDKEAIAKELKKHILNLQALEQPKHIEGMVCSINEQAVRDESLSFYEPKGPFESLSKLVDYLVEPSVLCKTEKVEQERATLLALDKLVFTHGDLNPSNIIVKLTKKKCTVSLIDWAYSAWMPIYWESFDAGDILEEDRSDGWLQFAPDAVGSYPEQRQVLYDIRKLGCIR